MVMSATATDSPFLKKVREEPKREEERRRRRERLLQLISLFMPSFQFEGKITIVSRDSGIPKRYFNYKHDTIIQFQTNSLLFKQKQNAFIKGIT